MSQELQPVTEEALKEVVPKSLRKSITPSLIETINKMETDPLFAEDFRESVFGYSEILKEGKYKIESYLNAVKYVTRILKGSTKKQAYIKTFPERYDRLVDKGATDKAISAYITAYDKTQLVNLIREQTLIAPYIYNAGTYQKAIEKQAYLMMHARSEHTQMMAADSVLKHLKPPETTQIELNVGITESSAIADLKKAAADLAQAQRQAITSGQQTAHEIAECKIVEGKAEFIEDAVIISESEPEKERLEWN